MFTENDLVGAILGTFFATIFVAGLLILFAYYFYIRPKLKRGGEVVSTNESRDNETQEAHGQRRRNLTQTTSELTSFGVDRQLDPLHHQNHSQENGTIDLKAVNPATQNHTRVDLSGADNVESRTSKHCFTVDGSTTDRSNVEQTSELFPSKLEVLADVNKELIINNVEGEWAEQNISVGGEWAEPKFNSVGGESVEPIINSVGGEWTEPITDNVGEEWAESIINSVGGELAQPISNDVEGEWAEPIMNDVSRESVAKGGVAYYVNID